MKIQWYETRTELVEEDGETLPCDPVTEDEGEIDCTPDEYDTEEGLTAAHLAAKFIRNKVGCIEASSSVFHVGVWYTPADSQTDIHTGDKALYALLVK